MESSQFTDSQRHYNSLEPVNTQGAICDTFRVKLYGKLHFLKRLKPEFVNDIRYQEAFRKEFETGYRLEHPHLVRYVSLADDGILMEYIDGETLTQRLANHPEYFEDNKNTDKFLFQLLDVVGYMHSHQVLHLDLKPDNILLTRINDDLKLVDLGCSYTDTFVDTQGHTNRFAAPEQLAGENTDVRTDIYAIGRILELLPCHHIYNKVIARCTAPRPLDRYQSIDAIQSDIHHAKSKKRLYFSLCALLVLFIVVVLFYSLDADNDKNMSSTVLATDSVKAPDNIIVEMKKQPGEIQEKRSTAPVVNEKETSLEQLRMDIQKTILPKFNQTVGALPDSIMPGTVEWAEACRLFEPMITESLRDLIVIHQTIPMNTITKEFNDYVQSLLTVKMNKAIQSNN